MACAFGRGVYYQLNMKKTDKPYGRKEVTEAILKTAAELFSKKGVAAVTLREIAAKAKVNLGLIHRHFGSKDNLRRKVQDYLSEKALAEIDLPQTAADGSRLAVKTLRENDMFWRVLARTLLDGEFAGDVKSEFKFVKMLVELVRQEQENGGLSSDMDPRVLTAGAMALTLGLLVFEEYIVQGTGLDAAYGPEAFYKISQAWQDYFLSKE